MYGTLGGVLNFTSIVTLVFMSIERYLIVKNPFYSLKITTNLVIGINIINKYMIHIKTLYKRLKSFKAILNSFKLSFSKRGFTAIIKILLMHILCMI